MKKLFLATIISIVMTVPVFAADLTLTLTVPDAIKGDVVDAFAYVYNYQPYINGQPNPQSKANFAKAKLKEYVRGIYKKYKKDSLANISSIETEADTNSLNVTVN